MEIVGTEVRRYTVKPEETGIGYPLQVIIYQPRDSEGLKAKVVSVEQMERYALSDDAITWEDAAWQ